MVGYYAHIIILHQLNCLFFSCSGSRSYKLPVFLLGLSFFGFGKKSDEKPEDEDDLIWELKRAKHSEYKKVNGILV